MERTRWMAKPVRAIGGTAVGALLMSAEPLIARFAPRGLLEILGWASIPEEIHTWQGTVMWSFGHVFIWLPIAMGISLIFWANWESIKVKLKTPFARLAIVAGIL